MVIGYIAIDIDMLRGKIRYFLPLEKKFRFKRLDFSFHLKRLLVLFEIFSVVCISDKNVFHKTGT